MSAAAWRMSREERTRSAARIAALASAAAMPVQDVAPAAAARANEEPKIAPWTPPSHVRTMPVAKPVTAAASVAAERPARPIARVPDLALNPVVESAPATTAVYRDGFLGGDVEREHSGGRQRGLMVAAAIVFAVLGGGAYWTLSGGTQSATTASAAPASAAAPLELISLRHERHAGRLSVSGLVRNPSAGTGVDNLIAVVFLFDAQGGFLSSARAGVDFKRLAAGDESPFVIALDAPANVARYRVSFRTDAGIVAHIDRRSDTPVTTTAVKN
jgi:hypothetical protein